MKKIFLIFALLATQFCNDDSKSKDNSNITNIFVLQQLAALVSSSSSSSTTSPTFTTLTLGTQSTGVTNSSKSAYFKFTTTTATTYYYSVYGKSVASAVTMKLYNSTTKLDSTTQLQTKTSLSTLNGGDANSTSLEANKEYAIEVSTTNSSDLSFQFIVLNNHVSGKASCVQSLSTDCTDFPSGSTLSSCPSLSTNYSTSSCATRFPAKTIVGRCTLLFGEGENTVYTKTYYNDGTYTTTNAASSNCTSSGLARLFTSN